MFFRNRRLARVTACLLLVETLFNLALPTVSYAVMGPNQPEFTSYDSPGATDMVNLATGDFTYQLPVLEVPGPEGSVSMPLTYRAGIRLEQEATWVGLGWSMNAGAISRNVSGYPDDAAGEFNTSTFQQTLNRGWQGSILGIVNLGWDSETGRQGSVDLIGLASVGWKGGRINSGDVVGVRFERGEPATVDAKRMIFAGITIATLGAAGVAGGGAAVAKNLAFSAASSAVSGAIGNAVMLGRASDAAGSFNSASTRTNRTLFHMDYWNLINDNKTEQMYGELNFHKIPRLDGVDGRFGQSVGAEIKEGTVANGQPSKPLIFYKSQVGFSGDQSNIGRYAIGAAGDVHQFGAPEDDFEAVIGHPLSISHDNYSVMGEGISGSIRPYRLEVGTVPYPKSADNLRLQNQLVLNHFKYNAFPFAKDYKPQFRYEGSTQNSYDYHSYEAPANTDPTGIEVDINQGYVLVKDESLFGANTSNSTQPATRTAPARTGYIINGASHGRKVVQGKHIDWYTNREIAKKYDDASAANSLPNFLEFQAPASGTATKCEIMTGNNGYGPANNSQANGAFWEPNAAFEISTVQSDNVFRAELPGDGIGAFAVTNEDGTTYHYSLPVYHHTQSSYSRDKLSSGNDNLATRMMGSRTGLHKYATTWLLTAITSPDYVDRGQIGVVDAEDWGGWVKYDYGKFSSKYKWRQPYIGEMYSPEDLNSVSVSEGYKETYYLNSISTRTHTALFIKNVRRDGRGHFVPGRNAGISTLGIDESTPSSSLRLDEVVLLRNEDVAKLQTVDGIRDLNDSNPTVIPALLPSANPVSANTADLRNGDTYDKVYDVYDVAVDNRIKAYLKANALKRIRFNYSYRLCSNTPNSFSSVSNPPSLDPDFWEPDHHTGKLTLESISTFGPGGSKLSPDFLFTYAQNPSYGINKWDGFGMYARDGEATLEGHYPSSDPTSAGEDGAAWSLTDITTPLGSAVHIQYERDQYAFVSEYGSKGVPFQNDDCGTTLQVDRSQGFNYPLSSVYKPGDRLWASGYYIHRFRCITTFDIRKKYERWVTIVAVGTNSITVSAADEPIALLSQCPNAPFSPVDFKFTLSSPVNTSGGELRVAKISTTDDAGHSYETRYEYVTDLSANINSAGVIAQEPAFIKKTATPYSFYQLFDYPNTPVIYSKVAVLKGGLATSSSDYDTKEEYSFYTPHSSMVAPQQYAFGFGGNWPFPGRDYNRSVMWFLRYNHDIDVNTGLIGQVKSLVKKNKSEVTEFSSEFNYSDQLPNDANIPNQGRFTEGVMTMEMLYADYHNIYNFNRTTKTYHPVTLRGTTTTSNGITVRTSNDKYDPITGQVLVSTSVNSLGDTYRTTITPAYTKYGLNTTLSGMGPMDESAKWKNMLLQQAGMVVTKERGGQQSVVSASAQTWKSTWEYRAFNPSTGVYEQQLDASTPIWRKYESLLWSGISANGPVVTLANPTTGGLNPDGTQATFTPFGWGTTTSIVNEINGWQKTGEIMTYDRYSGSLQSRAANGQFSAQKHGYDQSLPLLNAYNARYTEVAYSGAEDLSSANNASHFGGEVMDASRASTYAHTGKWSSELKSNQSGFTYKAQTVANNTDLTNVRVGKKYRLSAWVHASDLASANCKLYAKLDGVEVAATTIRNAEVRKAGDWYQINTSFIIPSTAFNKNLVVGCRHVDNSTTNVFVDDFRFQPVEATMAAYVYDAKTEQISATLDNDNFFTRYQYDVSGRPLRVHREVLDRPNAPIHAARLIKEYKYNMKRDRLATWIATGNTQCQMGAPDPWGYISPTGYEEQEEVDQNPQSPSYNQVRWVPTYYNAGACKPCRGLERWIDRRCETPVRYQVDCSCNGDPEICTKVTVYRYSNGSMTDVREIVSRTTCDNIH